MLDIRLRKVVEPNDENRQATATASFDVFDDAAPEKVIKTIWLNLAEGDDVKSILSAKIAKLRVSIQQRKALRDLIEAGLDAVKAELRR